MNYCKSLCRTIQRLCNSGGLLPPEYQQVEYLESTGVQYLNIGAASNHQYYSVDFIQVTPVYSVYGATYNTNMLLGNNNVTKRCAILLRYKAPFDVRGSINAGIIGGAGIDLNTRYNFYVSPTEAKLNGVDVTTATTTAAVSNVNCYVFCCNNFDTTYKADYFSALKLFHLQTSSIDLYPCYRKSDNKPGMFDIVNNTFYTNAGTGADFTVGNNV